MQEKRNRKKEKKEKKAVNTSILATAVNIKSENLTYVYKILPDLEPNNECCSCDVYTPVLL
jgi:hypothetical protein